MKKNRTSYWLAIFVGLTVLILSGCTSMTQIQTVPSEAKIYINDEYCGITPFTLIDNKIIGSTSYIRLEKEGYKPLNTVITKTEEFDAGPVLCGCLFTPVCWLWGMKYKPVHFYELVPLEN